MCIRDRNGAFQYGEEDRKGTLEVGKLADFCVVEHNPLKVDICLLYTSRCV